MALANDRFWVVDVEGNGATPPEIVELSMVEVDDLQLTGRSYRWLIKPRQAIQPLATRIHGLTNEVVAGAPSIEDVASEVVELLDRVPVVGHNVRVEVDALTRALPKWSTGTAIDTLRLAKFLRPSLESYTLERIGQELGCTAEAEAISKGKLHSALYDATLTALVFVRLLAGEPTSRRSIAVQQASLFDDSQGSLI